MLENAPCAGLERKGAPAWSSLRLRACVSRNRHAEVYRCADARGRSCSLKAAYVPRKEGVRLSRLFDHLALHATQGFPMPPVLRCQAVPEGIEKEASEALWVLTPWTEGLPLREAPCGSFGYTSPEGILLGARGANETMDVFSFGVVAHELLAGRWPHPFRQGAFPEKPFWMHYYAQGGAMRLDDRLPLAWRDFLAACLSLDPQRRLTPDQLVSGLAGLPPCSCGLGAFGKAGAHADQATRIPLPRQRAPRGLPACVLCG